MEPGALKVNALIMLVSSCLALWATAQQAPHDPGDLAGEPGALPPYVVVPDPRPWEADGFRATGLRYTLRGAIPSEARPSYTAEEAGLTRLEKGSALVFHSPARAELAAEVVDLLERQHRMLAYYTRQPFMVLPVVVVGAEEDLPKPLPFWMDIDGVTCWKLITAEQALPLTAEGYFWADVAQSWLYHGTIHECCHHGTCYDLHLMPERWFCEGLSDYLAALVAVCYSGQRDKASAAPWIESLEQISQQQETINILDGSVWWAREGGRLGGPLELAAYAASQYTFAQLVHAHGYDWIARVLKRVEAAGGADTEALIGMIEAETGEKNLRPRLEAVRLGHTLAYLKQGLPQPAPGLPAPGIEPQAAEPARSAPAPRR